jgi:hypothetical protein
MVKIIDYVRCELKEDGAVTCSFEDWNKDFTGTTWEEKMTAMAVEGKTIEEVEAAKVELLEAFKEWCGLYEVKGCVEE